MAASAEAVGLAVAVRLAVALVVGLAVGVTVAPKKLAPKKSCSGAALGTSPWGSIHGHAGALADGRPNPQIYYDVVHVRCFLSRLTFLRDDFPKPCRTGR